MSKNLNESPVIRKNEEYIARLEKRANKLRERLYSYRRRWNPKTREYEYRHRSNNRRISDEKYEELSQQYSDARQKAQEIHGRESKKIASKVKDYVIAFIVMDKKQNPELYPDWLSLDVEDSWGGNIIIQPHIDLEKLLEEKGNTNMVRPIERRINMFIQRYFTETVRLDFKGPIYKGIDNYIKNVFRKEIRPRIMKDIDDSHCIHSIVFRVRNRTYAREIQIHPRFRDKYMCRWSVKNAIEREVKKILREYGWVEGRNYTDSTRRD
jgi:hypothetical protein